MTKAELENRVKELEAELQAKDEIAANLRSKVDELIEKLESDSHDQPRPSENEDSEVPSSVSNDPFEAALFINCIGVLRDRMSGSVLSDKEFNVQAPLFVQQASRLFNLVKEELK